MNKFVSFLTRNQGRLEVEGINIAILRNLYRILVSGNITSNVLNGYAPFITPSSQHGCLWFCTVQEKSTEVVHADCLVTVSSHPQLISLCEHWLNFIVQLLKVSQLFQIFDSVASYWNIFLSFFSLDIFTTQHGLLLTFQIFPLSHIG